MKIEELKESKNEKNLNKKNRFPYFYFLFIKNTVALTRACTVARILIHRPLYCPALILKFKAKHIKSLKELKLKP